MYYFVLCSAEFLSPAIYSPDGEATRSAMEYSTVKDMPREVSEGHPPTVIRSSGMYDARTLSCQRKLPCGFAARGTEAAAACGG